LDFVPKRSIRTGGLAQSATRFSRADDSSAKTNQADANADTRSQHFEKSRSHFSAAVDGLAVADARLKLVDPPRLIKCGSADCSEADRNESTALELNSVHL
jgi:hypothetical protein